MRSTPPRRVLYAAVTALLPLSLLAVGAWHSASAKTESAHAAAPAGRLTLTTQDTGGGTTRRALAASRAELTCHPAGGTHPRAAEACSALDAVHGDFTRMPGRDGFCTQEYAPVKAHAYGTWKGRPIDREVTYGNRCALKAETGPVFDF